MVARIAIACLLVVLLTAEAHGSSSKQLLSVKGDNTINVFENSVETKYGTVRGSRGEKAIEFLGIPYAEPPVDDLRFKPAEEPRAWDGVHNGTKSGPGCPQRCTMAGPLCPTIMSEDCLYLDVYVPEGKEPEEGWPVFVWIHGGAFMFGSGGSPIYRGKSFTENGVILVTINYRLGALGWLNYGDIEGNFGLSDQRMALKWVRENIAAFGGNANQVTVGGESAGAMSILVHLASPASKGLFDRAIVESGTIGLPYNQPEGPNSFFKSLMKKAGCPQSEEDYAECLGALDVDDLLDAQDAMTKPMNVLPIAVRQPADLVEPFYPLVGTRDVPQHPLDAFKSGDFNRVPTIIGNNADEGTLFVSLLFGNKNVSKFLEAPAVISGFFGLEESMDIRNYYPVHGKESAKDTLSDIVTDYFFSGSTRKVANLLSEHNVPVYTYLFDYLIETPFNILSGGDADRAPCKDKVCHGDEVPFIFDDFRFLNMVTDLFTELFGGGSSSPSSQSEDERVSRVMSKLWTDFIKSEEDTSVWPKYTRKNKQWLEIRNSTTVVNDFNGKKLQFWDDEIGYNHWPHKI